MNVLVEVVACTADDAVRAEAAGADRIELVSAISEGGLTPSIGALLETKARCGLPVMVMIRPRGGGFVYSHAEVATMFRDAEALLGAGADGLVTGILADGKPNDGQMARIVRLAGGRPVVFHRAFDLIDDPKALERVIDLGLTRVLSAGCRNTSANPERLREYHDRAGAFIEVLAAGGIRANNAADLVRRSGVDQIHLGPFKPKRAPISSDHPNRSMAEHLSLDADEVRRVVELIGNPSN